MILPLAVAAPAGADATTCAKPSGALTSFHATFTNGTLQAGNASATGLSAKACGAVVGTLGNFSSEVQPGDIAFAPAQVKILFLSLPTTITVNAPITGPVHFGPGFTSADLSLSTNMTATSQLLAFRCAIGPITPTLTTGTSGALTGTTFTGSLSQGFTGTVVANDFAVPAITPSGSCPFLVAGLANLLAGLPAAPGKASITMDGSITSP